MTGGRNGDVDVDDSLKAEVHHFLTALESDRGFAANTISAYRNDLDQFVKYVRNPPADDHVAAIGAWPELTENHLSA